MEIGETKRNREREREIEDRRSKEPNQKKLREN